MLKINDVSVKRGERRVLQQLNLELRTGVHALLGVNGAGKSTLLQAIAGVLAPDLGRVTVCGYDPYVRGERSMALKHLALVPQEFDFPRHLRLAAFMEYMCYLRAIPREARSAAIRDAIEAVGLQQRLNDRLSTLSGGMLRRALFAQALLSDPAVILCDESTSGLDPEQRSSMRELVLNLGESRCCIFATHIIEDVDYLDSHVLILHEGQLRFDGEAQSLRETVSPTKASTTRGSNMEQGFLAVVKTGSIAR